MDESLDIVGLSEISAMLGLEKSTVYHLSKDGKLPDPDATVSRSPVWRRSTILRWADEVGRKVIVHT